MTGLKAQVELLLAELRNQIADCVAQQRFGDADFFLAQYAKLAPTAAERYALEAMLRAGQGDWEKAEAVLTAGLEIHPLSFDLLYNRGYVYEQTREILRAYHSYMLARYIAAGDREKADVGAALKRLVKDISGNVRSDSDEIAVSITLGEQRLTLTAKMVDLRRRKQILGLIEKHLARDLGSILEIGFVDGIISKTLNYFGFDVTAVDRHKQRLLNVIAAEWHDNILQPDQKVAKFYYERVDLDWMRQVPEYDGLIAVARDNPAMFDSRGDDRKELLSLLLQKAGKQLFLAVSPTPSDSEFYKEDLVAAAAAAGLRVQVIGTVVDDAGAKREICLVNKEADPEPFRVPAGAEAVDSPSTLVEVELSRCTDSYGAGYIDDEQHFAQTLRQYAENPDLTYADSALKQYYTRFCPRNTAEALFVDARRAPRLKAGWTGFPWYGHKGQRVAFSKERAETRPGGNHHFGPNTEAFGADELARLVPLYNLFQERGYHPELFSDGYISGYMLAKGDNYRFVIAEGQHRVAALAALGYTRIRCRFTQQPQYPRVVLWDEVKKWPQVANGAFSVNLARKIFARFFAPDVGRARLRGR